MAIVQSYEIILSNWPDEDGEYYYTISDGVKEKGEFKSKKEAQENMCHIIANWRCDN